MSRPAAAARQKPEPIIRRTRFAEEDLVSTFGEAMLAEARRLLRAGSVNLAAAGPTIEATIAADGGVPPCRLDPNPKRRADRLSRNLRAHVPSLTSARSEASCRGGRLRPSRGGGVGRARA